MLFTTPDLSAADERVLSEIADLRTRLRHYLYEPRRWQGVLRRNLMARAIQGSNSIEGYEVSLDDAVALVDDDVVVDADRQTVLELTGYRNAMTYIQQLARDPDFSYDETLLRSLHFMMLGHDLTRSPGSYRRAQIFVRDESTGDVVYEGPAWDQVGALMRELVEDLQTDDGAPSFVRAAMAHLDLVMIHPFRDGNGRMARALQTLVLARSEILEPEFSSIEEWLGRNTADYYSILAATGHGHWAPAGPTHDWVQFNLRAHHIQAQTVLRRVEEAGILWTRLESLAEELRLPSRVAFALYPASTGLRLRRTMYERDAELEAPTAHRDLRALVNAGLLTAEGATRGRVYVATDRLRDVRRDVVATRSRLIDPYRRVRAAPRRPGGGRVGL